MIQFYEFLSDKKNQSKIKKLETLWKREFKYILVDVFEEYYFNFVMRCLRKHLSVSNYLQSSNNDSFRTNNSSICNEVCIAPYQQDFDSNLNISDIECIAKESLSNKAFHIFQLKDLNGLTSKKISSILKMNVGSVDTAVSRYRKKLRPLLSAA